MARKSSSTAVQEELYPLYDEAPRRESIPDSRVMDLEAEQESPFLRGQKRVSVRRGALPKNTALGLKWVAVAVVVLAICATAAAALYSYAKHSWRFRIDSSDQIEVVGAQHVPRAQIMEVMGGDIGRNVNFVPLAERKHQLEQIPWVESASVMRFMPNRLRIEIHERTPVAFARVGSRISLIDAGGNLMELPPGPKHKYSFPAITGMNANEPLSTRSVRMKSYNELIQQLDSGGAHYSQDLSEVDLSDGEDVKVLTADPNGDVLVHLGNANYLQRYKVYVTHVAGWRQQFDKLDSVDLRYDGQIIVNPDMQGIARQPMLTPAATKAALAAGVKNAAIVNYEKYVARPAPFIGPKLPPQKPKSAKPAPKAASKPAPKTTKKKTVKATAHRATAKPKSKAPTAAKAAPAPAHPAAQVQKLAPTTAARDNAGASQKKPSAAIAKETPQN